MDSYGFFSHMSFALIYFDLKYLLKSFHTPPNIDSFLKPNPTHSIRLSGAVVHFMRKLGSSLLLFMPGAVLFRRHLYSSQASVKSRTATQTQGEHTGSMMHSNESGLIRPLRFAQEASPTHIPNSHTSFDIKVEGLNQGNWAES